MDKQIHKKRLYILTIEELERFDHMITALMQAYWSLVTRRSIELPDIEEQSPHSQAEEDFYQLHFEFNETLDLELPPF